MGGGGEGRGGGGGGRREGNGRLGGKNTRIFLSRLCTNAGFDTICQVLELCWHFGPSTDL